MLRRQWPKKSFTDWLGLADSLPTRIEFLDLLIQSDTQTCFRHDAGMEKPHNDGGEVFGFYARARIAPINASLIENPL